MPQPKDGGRQGVGKLDMRLEDDALFKEIGGQLDASNFDYAQWQRTGKAPGVTKPKDARVRRVPKTHKTDSASTGPGPWTVQMPKKDSEPPGCHYGLRREKQRRVNAAQEAAVAKQKAEQIKILQLRIGARKQTIDEYRKRHAELLLSNMEMRDTILLVEREAHEDVKKLLRKYEKYRGGINTLNERFVEELADAKSAFEETKEKVETDLAGIESKVDDMDSRLKQKQVELHTLVNYKDKEYPVKSLRISELQTEIAELKINQDEEEGELGHIVDTEIDKFKKEDHLIRNDITQKATEEAISRMHPSLKDMAMQNIVMGKEIDFHQKEINSIKEENTQLEDEVKALIKDPRTSIRRQMFPEFFPTTEKCTPEMEVILDIPTQQWLPI